MKSDRDGRIIRWVMYGLLGSMALSLLLQLFMGKGSSTMAPVLVIILLNFSAFLLFSNIQKSKKQVFTARSEEEMEEILNYLQEEQNEALKDEATKLITERIAEGKGELEPPNFKNGWWIFTYVSVALSALSIFIMGNIPMALMVALSAYIIIISVQGGLVSQYTRFMKGQELLGLIDIEDDTIKEERELSEEEEIAWDNILKNISILGENNE